MQEIDNTLFAMILSTSIILLMSGLFIAIIFRNLKSKEEHKKAIFESIYITQEEERGRIAMELHDDLGSTLLGIKLNLEALNHLKEPEAIKNGVADSLLQLSDAIQTTRLTSQTLMPQTLKNYGLACALNDLIKRYSNAIAINMICELEDRFSQIVEINIYRILSELICNTIKHAKATKIDIFVQREGNHIYISFADDGTGFDYHSMNRNSKGLGVNNINNRVAFLKGSIQYLNNSGSTFTITIPIN